MALIHSIAAGTTLAVLDDGTLVHVDRVGTRRWHVVHSAADGTRLAVVPRMVAVTDVAPHPTDAGSGVVAVPSDGVEALGGGALVPFAAAEDVGVLCPAGGGVAAVTRGRGARRLLIDGAGVVADVGAAPAGVVDAVEHPAGGGALLALVGSPAQRRLVALGADGSAQKLLAAPGARRLSRLAAGDPRVAIGYDDGRVEVRDPAAPSTALTLTTLGAPVWGLAWHGAALAAGSGSVVDLVPLVEEPGVDLALDPAHYLGSWTRVGVTTRGGVAFDDLSFVVDPPHGGLVSASRDIGFDAAAPEVLMSIGGVVGSYRLLAVETATATVLGAAEFSVVDAWNHDDGPPASYIGPAQTELPDAAWGGGDPYVPQNMDVRPRLGQWRVGVVVVETADQAALTAAGMAALQQTLREEVFTGVVRGGVTESTRQYFDAVSSGLLDLVEAGIVGVQLPNDWDTYTADTNAMTGRTNGDGLPAFSTAAVAEIVRRNRDLADAGQPPLLDLDAVDSLVLVLRSIPAGVVAPTDPGRFQWPFGTRPGGYQLTFVVGSDPVPWVFPIEIPRLRTIQALTMPHDWDTRTTRTLAETIGHELGHNFGLHDAYFDAASHDAEFATRELSGWDLMGWEGGAPEMSAPERMQLGWVPAGDVRTLSVGVAGYVDEEVTLHPAGFGTPVPAGRRQAIELRIADGRNYYFEYRRRDASALSDQTIAEDLVVVGTDYVSGDTPPTNRRPLTLLRDDADADGATFAVGDDYEETDTTDPAYPNDFAMTVLETAADRARVRLRYADAKPDPSIRPWAASTNWKSPDLRVENARNLADPAFADLPWEGHDNWVVATVRNTGRDVATDIEVTFGVKDFTLAGGAETSLGAVTIPSLAAGADVEVTSPDPWRPPPLSGLWFFPKPHYCVVARITAQADEITRDNNEAQSNHTRLISASGSPSSRETALVKVTNPHRVPARCRVAVRQTDPLSRTYLERSWVLLQPGEERDVRFWTESMIGDPVLASYTKERQSASWEMPNSLRLTGIADTGTGCHGDVVGGAHVQVVAGRRTRFVELVVSGRYAHGRVEVEETGDGVWGGVLVVLRDDKDGKDLGVHRGEVRDGHFRFEFREPVDDARVAQAEFLGGYSAAPCLSDWVAVQ